MLEWIIIGGGFQGTLLSRVLTADAGVPLDRIQYWLEHSSITTTEMYAHLIPEAIRYESARVFPEQAAVENVGLLSVDIDGEEKKKHGRASTSLRYYQYGPSTKRAGNEEIA